MVFLSTPQPSGCIYYAQGRCAKGDQCRFSHARTRATGTSTPGKLGGAAVAQPKPATTCEFYQRGLCRFGEACKNDHRVPIVNPSLPPSSSSLSVKAPTFVPSQPITGALSSERAHATAPSSPFGPCKFFVQGRCNKGDTCPFPHVKDASASEPFPRAPLPKPALPAPSRQVSEESISGDNEAQDSVDAATATRTKLGCTIVYGPGGGIQTITTAFESPCIVLRDLPPTITHAALIALAEPFGPLKSVILNPARDAHSRPSAHVEYLSPADAARAAQEITQAPVLKQRRPGFGGPAVTATLELRAAESGTALLRSTKAKLAWFAPSLTAWAHYSALSRAKEEARRLDGTSFDKRTIRAAFQTPTRNQRTSFSVELKGLPLNASLADLKRFCCANSVTKGRPSFAVDESVKALRSLLSSYGSLESFDFVPPDPARSTSGNSKLVAFVQFADPDAAEKAVAALNGARQAVLRGSQIFLEHIHSVKYVLPHAEFVALRPALDALRDALETCKLRYYDKGEDGEALERVCLRAFGPDAKALGRLKKELEGMLKGELVRDDEGQVLWHERFVAPAGRRFLESLVTDARLYIQCDHRRRAIHLFGSQDGRAAARARILAKAKELEGEEHIIELDEQTFRRMLHGGFKQLQATLGEGFFLDVVGRRLIVRGEDADFRAARGMVSREPSSNATMARTSTDDTPCPVCFCDVSEPVTLPCGHAYCHSCLAHYLGSLARSTAGVGASAALCLASTAGADGTAAGCQRGIPLDTIRALLSPGDEERLLDATFLSYIHSRPQEFKYCLTADCQTIYRAGKEDTVLRCPSCLARVCASCNVESHEGLSCAEYRDHASGGNESFRRWREEHDVKACPSCGMDLEKTGGCNHMRCERCGTHMCWVCMQTFTDIDSSGGVYAHMRREHGSIGL
ncbi:hypothetical protein OH77DRAFT_1460501 [Trametes cingulata]|nr:hypothetical protein OH77DRAFT_1460501 [Trametes cingulata]